MRCMALIKARQNGFTLVEIIITLVAAGILGAIFINLMGTALSASWNSVEMVREEADGVKVMEMIIADYVFEINTDPANALTTMITNNTNGNYTTAIGLDHISVDMDYIDFDSSGNAVPSALSDTLKVTVKVEGKDLINILTSSRAATDPLLRY